MSKRLMGGVIGLLMVVMVIAAIAQISANPVLSPPPPPAPTLGLGGDVVIDAESISSGNFPLPTQTADGLKEGNGPIQNHQNQGSQNMEAYRIPSREGMTPGELTRYRDSNFNISFSYPANWLLHAPDELTKKKLPPHGYLITIQNYDNVVSKRDLNQNELKIDLWLFPKVETFISLEDWVNNKVLFAPGTSYSDIDQLSVSGKKAITWSASGPTIPQGAKLIAAEQQDRILIFVAYPESSQFIWVLEAVFQSLE